MVGGTGGARPRTGSSGVPLQHPVVSTIDRYLASRGRREGVATQFSDDGRHPARGGLGPSKFRVMYSSTGGDIEIEDRGAEEVVSVGGSEIVPRGTGVMNPAFDVTSVGLITAIVTDRRVIRLDRGETLTSVSTGPPRTPAG